MPTTFRNPGRNALCPCGSGEKYKRCCAGKPVDGPVEIRLGRRGAFLIAGAAIMGSILLLTVLGIRFGAADPAAEIGTPAPWHYDAENNRHWHPGHAHWHDGPPPHLIGGFNQPDPAQPTPEPWEYDAANNRHWHDEHGHWHAGPPPPLSER